MALTMPPTTASLGKRVVIILDTPPDDPAAPTLAELNAGLFAACHIYGNIDAQPTQETGSGPSKMCSKVDEIRLGRITFPAFSVEYSYLPQSLGSPGATGNEVYESLAPETFKHVYIADGLDGEETDAIAEADVINHGFNVEVGEYAEGTTGDGQYDEFSCTQQLVPKGGRLLHNYAAPAA